MDRDEQRELVLDAVTEAFNDFIFYDRKMDKALPWDALKRIVREGIVTKDEISERFKQAIDNWYTEHVMKE
jgi:histone H3/H4